MGNCTASKLVSGDDAVELCKERKRLLKSAVDLRHDLAEAHNAYVFSLRSVAAAINLFVVRHSSPVLTVLPAADPSAASDPSRPPSLLQHTPSEPKTESLAFTASTPSSSSSSCLDERNQNQNQNNSNSVEDQIRCGYFFSGLPPPMPPSPAKDFGWDFFNPFDGVRAAEEAFMFAGLCRSSSDDLRAVREEEGIPDLEEADEKLVGEEKKVMEAETVDERGQQVNERRLTVAEPPENEKELLDALRDVEDQFIRAYDCGKEVSKMLEINRPDPRQSFDLGEGKENSSKLIQAITWHRSPSSISSRKSFASSSSSKDSLSIESKSDIFDDYGGMESGSHAQTLVRLYAWEKKLFEEVKAGDQTRQAYEKKCLQLRNQQDSKGADSRSLDKTRAAARDLYTRIWVALRSIETISIRIQRVRDEELQPQLIELLQGLLRTWKTMLESHETQKRIMSEVNSFSCPTYGKFCNDSQRQVTVRLEAELQHWRSCFTSYVAAQRAYVEALDGWLSKFFIPDVEYYSRSMSSAPPYNRLGAPPLLIICHDWSSSAKKLPDKSVSLSMKGFIKGTRVLWVKQGEEQQQKRKVDSLAKELDRRVLAFQKAENKVLESKLSDVKPEPDVRDRMEYLAGRKELLDLFRRKLDAEKVKHQRCMQETQRATLDGFRIGLTGVFEALAEFSKDCSRLYGELLAHNERAKAAAIEMEGRPSCIGGSQGGVDNR